MIPITPALPAVTRRTLAGAGLALVVEAAGREVVRIGHALPRARVMLHDPTLLPAVARLDLVALAEAYVAGRIDIAGDLLEVIRVGDHAPTTPAWLARLRLLARVRMPGAARRRLRAARFHYDRPADFFLPWLDTRWRSYSHGFYGHPSENLEAAQERKLAFAVEALRLRPGDEVLDIGTGWGCFLEYAGRRGIRVHGLTTSAVQHRFVEALITREGLPCTVAHADFLRTVPPRRFAAIACLGCLEHMPHYARVARQLARWAQPAARFYADFCAQEQALAFGPFLSRHVWPGPTACVATGDLVRALAGAGFTVATLHDDTASYGCTVRDWADRLERVRTPLAVRFGEDAVRVFLVYLRASQHFFATRGTQAWHLIAHRGGAG